MDENGSTRGILCNAKISCPVRMCHPIPASPSNRTDSAVNASRPRNATKIKSLTDGTIHRTHAGCNSAAELSSVKLSSVKLSADDLMEPIAIALNLIEWQPDRQENDRREERSTTERS